MGWKYVVIRTEHIDIPVIFPDTLVHKDVAERIRSIKALRDIGTTEILSAGDLNLMIGSVGGKSETLGLESRGEEDQRLMDSFAYGVRGLRGEY